jgi:hypothetical protein
LFNFSGTEGKQAFRKPILDMGGERNKTKGGDYMGMFDPDEVISVYSLKQGGRGWGAH